MKYKGKNIADVLAMTVSEAKEFFENYPRIHEPLKVLEEVGLGYINLGPSGDDSFRRGSAENQTGVGTFAPDDRKYFIYSRRADNRTSF